MGEVSQEEIVSIANNFLLNSPPGEFLEVAIDVRTLLKDETILNASAPDTFREYNTEQMMSVKAPQDHQVLICTAGEVGDGEYIDHKGKQIILFDHIRQQVTGTRPLNAADVTAEAEPLRAALDNQLSGYITEYFPLGAAGVYGGKDDAGKTTVTACISAARFQGANFNNGRWRSTWVATVDGRTIKLNATIKLHIHYYEDGNVQLNTDFNKILNVTGGAAPAATAGEILKVIQKTEAEFQAALELSYESMSTNTFKALRRALPITKNKIDWEKILKYRLGFEAGNVRISFFFFFLCCSTSSFVISVLFPALVSV
jgi:capping protein alpha